MNLLQRQGIAFKTNRLIPVLLLALSACSPTLNWREASLGGSSAKVHFPCKPVKEVRSVKLDGISLSISMFACQAGGATYAAAFADLSQPEQIAAALRAWLAAQVKNLDANVRKLPPVSSGDLAKKALPAERYLLEGRLPDGSPIQQELMFVVKGKRIFQGAVLSPQVDAEAAIFFVESWRWSDEVF